MKNSRIFLLIIVVVIAAAGGWYLSEPQQRSTSFALPTVGSQAPDFQLVDTQGNIRSLAAERGKVVLVNFWATWCPPCKAEMPSMEELYLNFGQGNFEILAINVDDNGPEVMPGFLKKNPHTFPILFDTAVQARTLYGVSMFPETFIVDKNGIIVRKVIGAIDWISPQVLSELNSLMKD
jgi:peroxiredoxin